MNSEELRKLKNRQYMRSYKYGPERRNYMKQSNLLHNVNPHRPDGRCHAIVNRCRFKCLDMGNDPGCTQAMKMAIIEVGRESVELQRGILHPDYLSRTAGQWSSNWRLASKKFKDKVLERYKSSRVDCDEFEPLQPQDD